jgi:hypothetical protein
MEQSLHPNIFGWILLIYMIALFIIAILVSTWKNSNLNFYSVIAKRLVLILVILALKN